MESSTIAAPSAIDSHGNRDTRLLAVSWIMRPTTRNTATKPAVNTATTVRARSTPRCAVVDS